MTGADLFAILCFTLVFRIITSLRLRRVSHEEQTGTLEVKVAPPTVAPMHMPIQIPPRDRPEKIATEKIVPEKLVVDGPIPGSDDPSS